MSSVVKITVTSEKAQDLVTSQNDLYCFIGLTFTLLTLLSFFYNYLCF